MLNQFGREDEIEPPPATGKLPEPFCEKLLSWKMLSGERNAVFAEINPNPTSGEPT